MPRITAVLIAFVVALIVPTLSAAQSEPAAPSVTVPRLIQVTGVFQPVNGQPADAVEIVTVSVYAEADGGLPVWQERQTVSVEKTTGQFTLLLGASHPAGIPAEVFASGDAQWMSLLFERAGEREQPRVRIASVPYALKASDAETLGGLPASAYLRAPEGSSATSTVTSAALTAPATSFSAAAVLAGTTNYLAKYVNGADVGNSAVYETPTANVPSGAVGIGTTSPLDQLHLRFTNTNGGITGLAVQNLGSTSTSYSGMLFYDQNGALGQFQGFNNSTHEYRINNIARVTPGGAFNGSINFMTGSTSRFFVATNGNIGMGTNTPQTALNIVRDVGEGLELNLTRYAGASASEEPNITMLTARGSRAAPSAVQFGDELGGFLAGGYGTTGFGEGGAGFGVFAAETWTDTAQGSALAMAATPIGSTATGVNLMIMPGGNVGIGTFTSFPALTDKLHVFGDIRVGTSGTNGCVKNFAGTGLIGTCASDRRYKKDITPFAPMLDRLTALQPVHYSWRAADFPQHQFGDSRAYGLIAQDAEEILPEIVATDDEGFKAVDYSKLPLLTIQAVKELKAENEALKQRVEDLERLFREMLAATAAR